MQLDLFTLRRGAVSDDEVGWLCGVLKARDWLTATEVLESQSIDADETARRRIRLIAAASKGQIGGGQRGYKLVTEMTAGEFSQFEHWMASQEREMKRRRIESQRVFFGQTNIAPNAAPAMEGWQI